MTSETMSDSAAEKIIGAAFVSSYRKARGAEAVTALATVLSQPTVPGSPDRAAQDAAVATLVGMVSGWAAPPKPMAPPKIVDAPEPLKIAAKRAPARTARSPLSRALMEMDVGKTRIFRNCGNMSARANGLLGKGAIRTKKTPGGVVVTRLSNGRSP